MTIFDYISDILFNKKKASLQNIDEENDFSPFLVNRWLSMYSTSNALICNTINKYIGIFDNKKDIFSLFYNLFNKQPYKKINYFKKIKDTNKEELNLDIIKQLAKSRELSIREIKNCINLLNYNKA